MENGTKTKSGVNLSPYPTAELCYRQEERRPLGIERLEYCLGLLDDAAAVGQREYSKPALMREQKQISLVADCHKAAAR